MRILLADDHDMVRHGLKEILAKAFPAAEFDGAGTARETLEKLSKGAYDVLVLDLTMPGTSGLDALKEIKQKQPNLPVLVLSMHPEELYALRVLKAAASGYLTKIRAAAELVEAIKKVMAGGQYINATVADRLVRSLRHSKDNPPHENLSDREFQILQLLASGKAVKEIGHELSLSIQTVSTYRTRLLQKLGLQTTAQLIRYGLEHQLIE